MIIALPLPEAGYYRSALQLFSGGDSSTSKSAHFCFDVYAAERVVNSARRGGLCSPVFGRRTRFNLA